MHSEPPTGTAVAAPRRGPSVDLDPSGVVEARSPDRQRRQFLNYAFYRLDPEFRRLPLAEQREAADAFIALVHGSSATVKKYYRERDGRIRLQPANETMQPIYLHENDIAIQGIVVGVLRRY